MAVHSRRTFFPGWRALLTPLIMAWAVTTTAIAKANAPATAESIPSTSPKSPTMPESQGLVKANGITIAYESYGPKDREAILLIMGYGAQLTSWPIELCDELVKRGYRVIIFDNRDIGLSTKLDGAGKPDIKALIQAKMAGKPVSLPYTLDDMAKDAVGLLDALDIKKAHVVGASMGGMIAQIVAVDHPEHTLSLTSIMSTSGNPEIPLPAKPEVFANMPPPLPEKADTETIVAHAIKLSQALGGPAYPTDEQRIRDIVIRTMKRGGNDRGGEARQNAAVVAGFYDDRRPKLKTLKIPAVIVHGAEDPLMSVEGGKDTAANIPGADLRIIPGMGHDLPIALVKTFADAITSAATRATGDKTPK